MDVVKAMELIEQLETGLAGMYDKLRIQYSNDPDLSKLFGDLYAEELIHARAAGIQRNVVLSNPADFGEVNLSINDFKQVFDYTAVVMGMPRDKLHEILIQCYLIESSMVEQYVVAALKSSSELRPLLDMLSGGFRAHLTALASRVKKIGLDVKNIEAIRKHPRVSFSEKIMINGKIIGKSVDISESGIFVLTVQVIPEGKQVISSFPLSGGIVSVKAVVKYSVPSAGIGLSFEDFSGNSRELIQRYIDMILEREPLDLGAESNHDSGRSGSA